MSTSCDFNGYRDDARIVGHDEIAVSDLRIAYLYNFIDGDCLQGGRAFDWRTASQMNREAHALICPGVPAFEYASCLY